MHQFPASQLPPVRSLLTRGQHEALKTTPKYGAQFQDRPLPLRLIRPAPQSFLTLRPPQDDLGGCPRRPL